MSEEQKLAMYAVECELCPGIIANNKLIDSLNLELKKLENGAVGIAKQTDRKKKQRLKQGKEKLLAHYNLEKDGIIGRLKATVLKIDADILAFTTKKEAEKVNLLKEYDTKIETYYIPHIAALYEQGSEDSSDNEVQPSYSPTYYAKKAQLEELFAMNVSTQRVLDNARKAIFKNEYIPTVNNGNKVVLSDEDRAYWAKVDEDDAIYQKNRCDSMALFRANLQMTSDAEIAILEAELKKKRELALAEDRMLTIRATN